MRFPVRFSTSLAVISALVFSVGSLALAQSSSSSSSQSSSQTAAANTSSQSPLNGSYISIDPLARVRYDNRYDVSLGLAYDHMKAGPTLLQGSNTGGLNLSGSYWLTKRWAAEASTRAYLGTSGAGVNPYGIKGPFVAQYFFVAGPEWLGPHNKHGAVIAHVLGGGAYGQFEKALNGHTAQTVSFYNNQLAPALIMGGHFDLNRNEHWVFRISPDAVMTHYGINYAPNTSQFDINFALAVGLEYKFSKKR